MPKLSIIGPRVPDTGVENTHPLSATQVEFMERFLTTVDSAKEAIALKTLEGKIKQMKGLQGAVLGVDISPVVAAFEKFHAILSNNQPNVDAMKNAMRNAIDYAKRTEDVLDKRFLSSAMDDEGDTEEQNRVRSTVKNTALIYAMFMGKYDSDNIAGYMDQIYELYKQNPELVHEVALNGASVLAAYLNIVLPDNPVFAPVLKKTNLSQFSLDLYEDAIQNAYGITIDNRDMETNPVYYADGRTVELNYEALRNYQFGAELFAQMLETAMDSEWIASSIDTNIHQIYEFINNPFFQIQTPELDIQAIAAAVVARRVSVFDRYALFRQVMGDIMIKRVNDKEKYSSLDDGDYNAYSEGQIIYDIFDEGRRAPANWENYYSTRPDAMSPMSVNNLVHEMGHSFTRFSAMGLSFYYSPLDRLVGHGVLFERMIGLETFHENSKSKISFDENGQPIDPRILYSDEEWGTEAIADYLLNCALEVPGIACDELPILIRQAALYHTSPEDFARTLDLNTPLPLQTVTGINVRFRINSPSLDGVFAGENGQVIQLPERGNNGASYSFPSSGSGGTAQILGITESSYYDSSDTTNQHQYQWVYVAISSSSEGTQYYWARVDAIEALDNNRDWQSVWNRIPKFSAGNSGIEPFEALDPYRSFQVDDPYNPPTLQSVSE